MRKKIAFISDHASPFATMGGTDTGGQNVYVAETAQKLAALGYEVDIFTRREHPKFPLEEDFATGVRVINISAGPSCKIPKENLFQFMDEFTDNTLKYIRDTNQTYELIHAHFWMSGMVAMDLKKTLNIPFVITFHALGYIRKLHQKTEDKFPGERVDIEKEIIKSADSIIAECPQDRYDLIRYYDAEKSRIELIPCGFSARHFWPIDKKTAKEKIGLSSKNRVVLQLGRMVPRKGIDNVISAFAIIAPTDPLLRLVIVGGDLNDNAALTERNRLQSIAQEHGIESQVTFTGSKAREDLKYYYSAADVFVSTPWYEPFGITPLESMACGTPVIGSNVGGIKFTVKHKETGLLVEPKNPKDLAEKLKFILDNDIIRHKMSQNGMYRAQKHFTWENVSFSLSNLYARVISEHTSSSGVLTQMALRHYQDVIHTFQRASNNVVPQIIAATEIIIDALKNDKKILVCGNGGSAAESQHFVAELIGRFKIANRKALPAISLNADTSVITAWANDSSFENIFARQIEALGKEGDILFCLSTSGQSGNLLAAIEKAKEKGLVCINLLGKDGGEAAKLTPHNIIIPSEDTARIQELHLNSIHVICEGIEIVMFETPPQNQDAGKNKESKPLKLHKIWKVAK